MALSTGSLLELSVGYAPPPAQLGHPWAHMLWFPAKPQATPGRGSQKTCFNLIPLSLVLINIEVGKGCYGGKTLI